MTVAGRLARGSEHGFRPGFEPEHGGLILFTLKDLAVVGGDINRGNAKLPETVAKNGSIAFVKVHQAARPAAFCWVKDKGSDLYKETAEKSDTTSHAKTNQ